MFSVPITGTESGPELPARKENEMPQTVIKKKARKSKEVKPAVKKLGKTFAKWFRDNPDEILSGFSPEDASTLQGLEGNGAGQLAAEVGRILSTKTKKVRLTETDTAEDASPVKFVRKIKGHQKTTTTTCIRIVEAQEKKKVEKSEEDSDE